MSDTVGTKELGLVAWNILHDVEGFYPDAPTQYDRRLSIAQSIKDIGISLDVVGLLEVQDDLARGNIGTSIAEELGFEGSKWHELNHAEHMGLFGNSVADTACLSVPSKNQFVMTKVDDITIVLAHLVYGIASETTRLRQIKDITDLLQDEEKVVVMADLNSMSWQRSRRELSHRGYESVFDATGNQRQPTVITPRYRNFLRLKHRALGLFPACPDDIYVKGVRVADCGVFEGDSDHRGVWATVVS